MPIYGISRIFIAGSPWTLEVMPKTKDEKTSDHGDGQAEDTTVKTTITDHRTLRHTQINAPTRVCDLSDLESSGKGRWVECAAADIVPEQCLFDGWVYLPYNCHWDLVNTIDALEISKEIADARNGKPVWIVVTGSSIERGTLQVLVDMLGGIGNVIQRLGISTGLLPMHYSRVLRILWDRVPGLNVGSGKYGVS